ncbi:MAG: Xaa-Pro peptidase family protein [Firmicutes bacterium]|nr:Xaa-Pro peptidase family protein [Bacillota bacterium]
MQLTPKSELDARIAKLQQLIAAADMDGVIILQNADLFYFTGTIQQAHLYVPAAGKPIFMVKKNLNRALDESALEEIVPLANLKEIPDLLATYGHRNLNRLGFELDVLPAALFLRYQKIFAPAQATDASPLIRRVKMVKSDYELGLLRESAQMTKTAFTKVKEYLREGVAEFELAAQLELTSRLMGHQGMIRSRGFNQEIALHLMAGPSLGVLSYMDTPLGGPGLSPALPQGAGARKIQRDEPVMLDYGGVYEGYVTDQTRTFCLGRLPEKMTRAYDATVEILEMFRQKATPGASCADIYEQAVTMAAAAGLGGNFMGYPQGVTFIGHGLGIELDEWPVIAKGFDMPLEAGMVVAVEPKFIFPEWAVGIENTFVIRDHGPETITEFEEGIIYL